MSQKQQLEKSINHLLEDIVGIFGVWKKLKPLSSYYSFVQTMIPKLEMFFFFFSPQELIILIMEGQTTILASMCDALHFYFVLRWREPTSVITTTKKNLADWPEMSLVRNEGQKDLGLSQADFTLETFFVFIIFVFISSQLLFLLQQLNFNAEFGLTGGVCDAKICKWNCATPWKRVSLPAVGFF